MIRLLVGMALLSLLAACASSDPCARNPRDDHLIGATIGVVSGDYNACADLLRTQLAEAEARAVQLERLAEKLERQAETFDARERELALRHAETNRAMQETIARLRRVQQQRELDQVRLAELRQREEQLSNRLLELDAQPSVLEAEIAALESERRSLEAEIEAVEDELLIGS